MQKNQTQDFTGPMSLDDMSELFNPAKPTEEEEVLDPMAEEEPAEEEKPVEEEEEVVVEKPAQEENIQTEVATKIQPTVETDFSKLAKSLITKGKWQDMVIEDEDGKEIPITEYKDLTEDMFYSLQEEQDKAQKEDLSTNYIPLKDVDDKRKTILDIVAKGGSLKDIFKSEANLNQYMEPFKGMDLENEQVQANLYENNLVQRGIDRETAKVIVQKAQTDLTLDQKAGEIVAKTKENFDVYVENKRKELEDSRKLEQEQEKTYRKNLQETYKEMGVKDSTYKKYIDLATKKTSEGEYGIDTIYQSKMEDPKEAADLIAFLEDKENFLKNYKKQVTTEVTKETLRKVKLIPSKQTKTTKVEEREEKKTGLEDIVMAEDL